MVSLVAMVIFCLRGDGRVDPVFRRCGNWAAHRRRAFRSRGRILAVSGLSVRGLVWLTAREPHRVDGIRMRWVSAGPVFFSGSQRGGSSRSRRDTTGQTKYTYRASANRGRTAFSDKTILPA